MANSFINKCPTIITRPLKAIYGQIPYERRLGKKFYDTCAFLQKTCEWSKEQKEEYQMSELKRLLNHAYHYVPYYRRIFDERGFLPDNIANFDDLAKIPYLTKELIRENENDLIALNYKISKLKYTTTGGTTGVPLGFYREKRLSDQIEWAHITSLWKAAGYDTGRRNRSVILRGISPAGRHYEYKGLNYILSSFSMDKGNMQDYIRRIELFDPDYIQAYPSSISILSNYILQNGIQLHLRNLKAVLCSSETLFEHQREIIRKAFNTRLFSFYGHSERCCLAGECEFSTDYHFVSEYGYTELINNKGKTATKENEAGEIVCTGFSNYSMPLIRYRTGDIAINTERECSCGRNCRMAKKILGRLQDFFIDKNGSPITFISACDALFEIKDKILAYQYIQNEPGKVKLNIEGIGLTECADINKVKNEFLRWYPSLELDVEAIEHIERTQSGKFRYLIQNLPVSHFV